MRTWPIVLLLGSLVGCTGSNGRADGGRIEEVSGGTVALGLGEDSKSTYRVVAVAGAGSLAGSIRVRGSMPPDSTVAATRDSMACGDTVIVIPTTGTDSSLANVLVWVDGVSAGKLLPEERRQRLTIEGCQVQPRVLAIVANSTINVFSRDRAVHQTSFYREGARQPVDYIHTVDAGQVVPSEKIASAPGIVEARCSRHPWLRAYVAVFDHPYFAVTTDDGSFSIPDLPPGTYTVKVWHERMQKPLEQRVAVAANGSARVDLALTLE